MHTIGRAYITEQWHTYRRQWTQSRDPRWLRGQWVTIFILTTLHTGPEYRLFEIHYRKLSLISASVTKFKSRLCIELWLPLMPGSVSASEVTTLRRYTNLLIIIITIIIFFTIIIIWAGLRLPLVSS